MIIIPQNETAPLRVARTIGNTDSLIRVYAKAKTNPSIVAVGEQ